MRIVRMSFRSPRYNNTAVSQVTSSLTQGGILKCQFRQSLENNGGGPELLQEKFHCWIPETPEINASRPIQSWTKVWRKNFICGSFVYYTCPSHTPNVKYDAGNVYSQFFVTFNIRELKQQRFWATDVNRKWTFCIIGQWFCWKSWVNRLYKRRET